MSYKALKEYFLSCPIRSCTAPLSSQPFSSVALDGIERKPPKGSLKDKIASWDLLGERNYLLDPRNAVRLSPLDKSVEDSGLGRKRSFLESSPEIERGIEEKENLASEGIHYRTGAPSRKRTKSAASISNPLQRGNSRSTNSLASAQNVGQTIEIVSDDEEQPTRIMRSGGEEEEGMGRDSEAGLLPQPEPEGPFEPLVLWPPSGEGSSNGVLKERIVQVPSSINSRLLEHQREGVHFLYNLYRKNQGGILGDDMGLGKTIQSIAFLAAILGKDSEMEETTSTKVGAQKQGCEKIVLIICPTTVLQNWEQEFNAWGEFQIGIYHGLHRESVLAKVEAKELEIVLTSQDTFRIHGEELSKITWDCVIVDEAHRLKNEKSQFYISCSKLPTKRRYGLTGTVMQNKCMELFNVFDWATEQCLGTRDHFREYYDRPIAEGQRISAPQRFVLIAEDRKKHLSILLRSYFLRRTKQETIGHLMKGKEDNVVFCPMTSVQKRAYKRVLQSPDFQALINKAVPCPCGSPLTRAECCYRIVPNGVIWSYLHKDNPDNGCDFCPYCLVLPCLTKLRQVSNHLELIKPNPRDDPEKQDKDYKFACLAFGEDADEVGGLEQDHSFLGLSDAQHCGKMLVLDKLLASWILQGDKVLLFSDSVRMLDILEKFLIRKGYCFSRLDGSIPMSTRQCLVEDFNRSPSKQIFLISTRAGGLGLNLTSANRVVIFDPNWNPAHDLQAQDRSFRYGQIRHVTVFRLLAAGSLEELVYTRQIYKQQLFNIALSGAPEKRYFEGVQHKGELFGISNLLRDMSEDLFAEDIIENHEERLVRIQKMEGLQDTTTSENLQLQCIAACTEEEIDHQGDLSCVETEDSGYLQLGTKEEDIETRNAEDNEDECKTQKIVQKVLKKAGVVYSHRNEDVVNLGPSVYKAPQRGVRQTSNVQQCKPKKPRKNEKQTLRKEKGNKVSLPQRNRVRPQQKRLSDGDCVVKEKDSNVPSINATKQVVGEDKRAIFAQLAKYKGMDTSEFSKWYLSASQHERTQLRSQYTKSLARI